MRSFFRACCNGTIGSTTYITIGDFIVIRLQYLRCNRCDILLRHVVFERLGLQCSFDVVVFFLSTLTLGFTMASDSFSMASPLYSFSFSSNGFRYLSSSGPLLLLCLYSILGSSYLIISSFSIPEYCHIDINENLDQ